MRYSILLRVLCIAFLPLFVGLAACDSGGSNGGSVDNEFSMDVSPKGSDSGSSAAKALRDTTIEGFSFFYAGQSSGGENVFGLYLSESESFDTPQQGLFGFFVRNSQRPGAGSYNLVGPGQGLVGPGQGFDSGNFIGMVYEDFGDSFRDTPFYVPQEGTVDLSESTGDKVSGTVDIPTAYAITYDLSTSPPSADTTEVTITGSFTAKSVENFVSVPTP